MKPATFLGAALLQAVGAAAQGRECPKVLRSSYPAPVVGTGWTAQLVADGLKAPRGILLDSAGHLLVVEQGTGIRRLTWKDHGGTCLEVLDSSSVVENSDLNHGIALSNDGKTLYASSDADVFAWAYDAARGTVRGAARTVVRGMAGTGHSTRTLLTSAWRPGMLLVSKGSGENVDARARDAASGVSQIRAFNMTDLTTGAYAYASQGVRLGWGLRNSVGVAEEPTTGGLFSVENSVDRLVRAGVDVHRDNPGEELNFHGFLPNASTAAEGEQQQQQHGGGGGGGNYGYPDCFALWDPDIPGADGLQVGEQFAAPEQSRAVNDTTCARDHVAPRLVFPAHTAPLDIAFSADGTAAYIAFHGSWNRDSPVGYMLASVAFADGQPTDPSTSTTALRRMLSNADLGACPDACFRPVGLAVDHGAGGRVFMSSDATGDIWVLAPADFSTGTPTVGGGDDDDDAVDGDGDAVAATPGNAGAKGFGGGAGLTLSAGLLVTLAVGAI